jgi:hypothetical protein
LLINDRFRFTNQGKLMIWELATLWNSFFWTILGFSVNVQLITKIRREKCLDDEVDKAGAARGSEDLISRDEGATQDWARFPCEGG